jgi:hypothetical protein
MADYNCNIQFGDSPGQAPPTPVTVGQVFAIVCDGDWSQFSPEQAEIRVDESDKYKIKLLSLEPGARGATLKVTSYQAGTHDLKVVQIVNAQESRVLGDLHFQVQSVIDPKQQPPPEPFGPHGPLGLSLPLWYFAVLLAVILLVVGGVTLRVRRVLQKRKMIRELEALGVAATPFAQFNQTMRRLRREAAFLEGREEGTESEKTVFVQELEKAYRLYLGRTFLIPTLHWNDSLILRELKSHQKALFLLCGKEVDRLFQEFARAKSATKGVQNKDLVQLFELTRKNVDILSTHQKKEEAT